MKVDRLIDISELCLCASTPRVNSAGEHHFELCSVTSRRCCLSGLICDCARVLLCVVISLTGWLVTLSQLTMAIIEWHSQLHSSIISLCLLSLRSMHSLSLRHLGALRQCLQRMYGCVCICNYNHCLGKNSVTCSSDNTGRLTTLTCIAECLARSVCQWVSLKCCPPPN